MDDSKRKKALLVSEASVYTDDSGKVVARGGGEVCFHNIAKGLLKLGVEPVVFAIREFDEQKESEEIDGVKYIRYPVRSKISFGVLKYLREAALRAMDFDYVFVNQFAPHLILKKLVGRGAGVRDLRPKLIAVVHDVYVPEGALFWLKQYGLVTGLVGPFLERLQLRRDRKFADVVMTVSESSKGKLMDRFGEVLGEKIVVNPNPFELVGRERVEGGGAEKENFILFVGRFVGYKHPEHVLYVLKKIREVYPDFKAVFVVSRILPKVLKKFETYLKRLGLSADSVQFIENCRKDELVDLFGRAKLFVQPSYVEGQGIVVIESLSQGTPVVAYNLRAYEGMLRSGENSELVKKGDKGALALASLKILGRYDEYCEKCVVDEGDFSEEKFVERLRKILG
ncbi:glycosyltransferase family 4 protein [Candidatus Peregrinibacteria bacterium]|nr:glycosyltransferase family 4 protein [Candidatus Peregrinibacteria bacterium]